MLPTFNLTWGQHPCTYALLHHLSSDFPALTPCCAISSLSMSVSCHTIHFLVFLWSDYTAPSTQLVFMCLHTTALGLLGPFSTSPPHHHSNHYPWAPLHITWDSCHFLFNNTHVLSLRQNQDCQGCHC